MGLVLLVEEFGVHGENHRHAASHWQNLDQQRNLDFILTNKKHILLFFIYNATF